MADKMKTKMKPKMKPMAPSELDYENAPISPEAIQEMFDKKAMERDKAAYDKAREYSLGSPDKKMKKGGCVKKMAKGGYVKAADGCAQRGKTKGKIV